MHICCDGMSEMEREKKPEFVVTDRRKFNVDGEPRTDAPVETSSPSTAPAMPAAESAKPPQPEQPQAKQPQPKPTAPPHAEKPAAPMQEKPR